MSLPIYVALLPEQLPEAWQQPPAIAVVIDTLRFTTTACQALAVGGRSIAVAAEVDAARQLAAQQQPTPPLLCGERLCRPIPGFDLGNSPWEYTADQVAGRQLIFTTTNGTRAVAAVQDASTILLGALVNRTAVARAVIAANPGAVCIVCAGTDGKVAAEDVLAAGAIVESLRQQLPPVTLAGDAAMLAALSWQAVASLPPAARTTRLQEIFGEANGGRNLIESGYAPDVDFAVDVDRLTCVPRADQHSNWSFVNGQSTTTQVGS